MRKLIDYIIEENNVNEGLFSKSLEGTKNGKNNLSGFSDEEAIFSIARKKSGKPLIDAKDSDRKKFDGGWSNSDNLRKVIKKIEIKNQKDIYKFLNKLGSKYAIVSLHLKWIGNDVKKKFKDYFGKFCTVESTELFVTDDSGIKTQSLVKLFNQTFYGK